MGWMRIENSLKAVRRRRYCGTNGFCGFITTQNFQLHTMNVMEKHKQIVGKVES